MKTLQLFGLALLAATIAVAAPAPYPVTVNSRIETLPELTVYRAGQHSFALTFKDGGTASDITGHTVWMSWATNSTATLVSTASVAIVTATNGTATATFSAAALNYTPGRYVYEVGVTTSGVIKVYRQGALIIRGSPYATGSSAVTWSSNIVIAAYNWIGTFPSANVPASPYADIAGVASNLTAAASNAFVQSITFNGTPISPVSGVATLNQTNVDVSTYITGAQVPSYQTNVNPASFATAAQGALADSAVQTNGSTPMTYLDLAAPTNAPSNPSSGVRMYGRTVNNQSNLHWTDGSGEYRIGRDLIHTIFNDDAATLSNGVCVVWTTNMTSTAHHARRAMANDATNMPCQGIVVNGAVTNGGSGQVMWMGRSPTGYLSSALSALPYGTPLYVSATVPGELVSTIPLSPNNQQVVGFVNFNGAIDVRLGPDVQPQAQSVFRTFQLWSASNSVLVAGAKAMRTLDYGSTGVGTWTNASVTNNQYITYCSGPAGAGLTVLKAGLYQVNVTMRRSTGGGDACSVSAEIYTRATNGVETEITPVAGTSAQSIGGTALEYIYSLAVSTDTVISATDSIELKFKMSGVGGTPTLYISTGYLQVPVPSGQFALQSEFSVVQSSYITQSAASNTVNAAFRDVAVLAFATSNRLPTTYNAWYALITNTSTIYLQDVPAGQRGDYVIDFDKGASSLTFTSEVPNHAVYESGFYATNNGIGKVYAVWPCNGSNWTFHNY